MLDAELNLSEYIPWVKNNSSPRTYTYIRYACPKTNNQIENTVTSRTDGIRIYWVILPLQIVYEIFLWMCCFYWSLIDRVHVCMYYIVCVFVNQTNQLLISNIVVNVDVSVLILF